MCGVAVETHPVNHFTEHSLVCVLQQVRESQKCVCMHLNPLGLH